jgi:hypothetical protein
MAYRFKSAAVICFVVRNTDLKAALFIPSSCSAIWSARTRAISPLMCAPTAQLY